MKYSACVILKGVSFFLAGAVIVALASGAFCAEKEKVFQWQASGELFTRFYQDVKKHSPYEDQQAVDAWLDLENRIDFRDWDAFLVLNLRSRGEVLVSDNLSREGIRLRLREAYLEIPEQNFNFSLGQQVVTWGKLDDVIILDRISPQDYRWFLLYDKQERKIPEFMFKYSYYWEFSQLEAIYLPEFNPSFLRFFGSDWAVFGHLRRIVRDGDYPAEVKDVVSSIRIEEKSSLRARAFKNGQFGLRLRSRLADADYALYYLFVNSDIPTLRENTDKGNLLKKFLFQPGTGSLSELMGSSPDAEDLILLQEHPRMHIIGADFETVLRDYGVRGEFGVFLNAPYLKSDFSYVNKHNLTFGLGIDHTTPGNFYYNIQGVKTIIIDYEDLFAQKRYTHLGTLTLRKDFLRGNLRFNLECAYNFSLRDRMFNPEISYKFSRGPKVALGGFIFAGKQASLFGRYSAKDMVYTQASYKF